MKTLSRPRWINFYSVVLSLVALLLLLLAYLLGEFGGFPRYGELQISKRQNQEFTVPYAAPLPYPAFRIGTSVAGDESLVVHTIVAEPEAAQAPVKDEASNTSSTSTPSKSPVTVTTSAPQPVPSPSLSLRTGSVSVSLSASSGVPDPVRTTPAPLVPGVVNRVTQALHAAAPVLPLP